jgi:mono/diheme cytochrome c family protein
LSQYGQPIPFSGYVDLYQSSPTRRHYKIETLYPRGLCQERVVIQIVPLVALSTILAGFIANGEAQAQETTRVAQGLALARQVCSECHAIDTAQVSSPNSAAPRFETIANISGMTSTALLVALRTSHQTMPNLVLDGDELQGVIAYILTLRKAD